jgi:DNA-binding NarL/FixJ family response regulator
MSSQGLTREFLAERDARIFAMRKAGISTSEIASRFAMSGAAVNAAVNRQLQRLNREALMAYPEVLRMELERLDALQQAIWPLTQHRKVQAPDGSELVVEPDLRAIQQVLAIMDRRSKLLGMETANVSITVEQETNAPQRAVLAGVDGAAAADAFDPETEARQLLELMAASGVLPKAEVEQLLGQTVERAGTAPELEAGDDVIRDAEIVE